MTYEEFLDFTRDKESLYELRNGVPTKMDAPVYEHQIVSNKLSEIFNGYLYGSNCQVICPSCDVIFSNKEIRVPDLIIVCDKAKLQHGDCCGAPDFIAEVLSPSNANKDFENVELYLSSGVKEYWIIDAVTKVIYIYLLNGNQFRYEYPARLVLHSSLFPDLPVDLKFLFDDYTRVEYVIYKLKLLSLNLP